MNDFDFQIFRNAIKQGSSLHLSVIFITALFIYFSHGSIDVFIAVCLFYSAYIQAIRKSYGWHPKHITLYHFLKWPFIKDESKS